MGVKGTFAIVSRSYDFPRGGATVGVGRSVDGVDVVDDGF